MDKFAFELISKEDAAAAGLKHYFTGVMCVNGHIERRYVNTGVCYGCKRMNNRIDRHRHIERSAAMSRRSYLKNKDKVNAYSVSWNKRNPEKARAIKLKSKQKNRLENNKRASQRARERRARDIGYRISKNLSKQVWSFLKGKKGGKSWEALVGYSYLNLKTHLESKFSYGMNWQNYGTYWEIDHIVPVSWHLKEVKDGKTSENEALRRAWSLNNLQPLERFLNRSKQNRNSKERCDVKFDYINACKRTESGVEENFETIRGRLSTHVDVVRLLHSGMGLCTESAEFLDAMKKYVFYGKEIDRVNLVEELGDLFFYMAIACDCLGVSFEEVMEKNIAKLQKRYPEKFTEHSAVNRDLESERKILES